jgi:hypothetical protein
MSAIAQALSSGWDRASSIVPASRKIGVVLGASPLDILETLKHLLQTT